MRIPRLRELRQRQLVGNETFPRNVAGLQDRQRAIHRERVRVRSSNRDLPPEDIVWIHGDGCVGRRHANPDDGAPGSHRMRGREHRLGTSHTFQDDIGLAGGT